MAFYTGFIKHFFNMDIKTIVEDTFGKKDPSIFKPSGSQIYHGMQGQGKTLTMFYHGYHKLKVCYPNAAICTNLHLTHMEAVDVKSIFDMADLQNISNKIDTRTQYIKFETYEDLTRCLKYMRNGTKGVIFMIDEIHNYFHSHDSKSMPMWIVQVFSQQRKQHLVILGTVQDWEDVIKAIRRQVDNLIGCNKLGHIIRQTVVDPRTFENNYGEREAPIKKKGFFWLTKQVREGFDTFQVINSGRAILGGNDMQIGVEIRKPEEKKGMFGRAR